MDNRSKPKLKKCLNQFMYLPLTHIHTVLHKITVVQIELLVYCATPVLFIVCTETTINKRDVTQIGLVIIKGSNPYINLWRIAGNHTCDLSEAETRTLLFVVRLHRWRTRKRHSCRVGFKDYFDKIFNSLDSTKMKSNTDDVHKLTEAVYKVSIFQLILKMLMSGNDRYVYFLYNVTDVYM